PALFAELLRLERDLRGPTCSPEEYRARFPEFAAQIDTAFAATVAARPKRAGRRRRAAAGEPEPPSVPNYDVLGRIDAGGMGVVYEAVHRGLGVKVALKVVRGEPWAAGTALDRFRAEARAVAALNHPNVVRIYDYGEWRAARGGPPPAVLPQGARPRRQPAGQSGAPARCPGRRRRRWPRRWPGRCSASTSAASSTATSSPPTSCWPTTAPRRLPTSGWPSGSTPTPA